MTNRKLIKVISIILIIAFFFQSNMEVVAAFQGDKENKQNLEENVKKK